MPLLLGFLLVALFIWGAENIGTFARAWTYPAQENGWQMVGLAKLGSWFLLMLISFVLVELVAPVRAPDQSLRSSSSSSRSEQRQKKNAGTSPRNVAP